MDRLNLETPLAELAEDQSKSDEVDQSKSDEVTVNIHSFFLLPFLILVGIGILFGVYILGITLLTQESRDVYDLLETIKSGRNHDRWRSAFELSSILTRDPRIGFDSQFVNKMTSLFQDPIVRQMTTQNGVSLKAYLAQAMGATRNPAFTPLLLGAIEPNQSDTVFVVSAIGMIGDSTAVDGILPLLQNPSDTIRLASVIALGEIGNVTAIPALQEALKDEEPNVRWDAAVALTKLNSTSGKAILLDLLRPDYLAEFESVDINERNRILAVAVRSAGILNDSELNEAIDHLIADKNNVNIEVLKTALEVRDERR